MATAVVLVTNMKASATVSTIGAVTRTRVEIDSEMAIREVMAEAKMEVTILASAQLETMEKDDVAQCSDRRPVMPSESTAVKQYNMDRISLCVKEA